MAQRKSPARIRGSAWCSKKNPLSPGARRWETWSSAWKCAAWRKTRGEIVLVIAPPLQEAQPDEAAVDDLLRQAFVRVSVKDAVSEVAAATGLSRREVYQRALALAKEDGDGAR